MSDSSSSSSSPSSSSSFPDADGAGRLVLVTGASGYIASHIVYQLLQLNYRVRGTVRSTKSSALTSHLLFFPNAGKLELVEADLLNDSSWAEAVKDCDFVLHTASPFITAANVSDVEKELIQPAVEGTLSVLRAVAATNGRVKRVVLTSSVASIMEGHHNDSKYPPNYVFTDKDWTDLESGKADGYPVSKTRAELAAWEFVRGLSDEQKFEFCTINPALVIGPLWAAKGCTSADIISRMLMKREPKPKMGFPLVDVRDVALAHIRAMSAPSADVNQKRFICSQESVWFKDIASVLHNQFKEYPVNAHQVPNVLVKIAGIFDKEARGITTSLGKIPLCDNTPAVNILGIQFRPWQPSLIEMANSMIQLGLVPDKRKHTHHGLC